MNKWDNNEPGESWGSTVCAGLAFIGWLALFSFTMIMAYL